MKKSSDNHPILCDNHPMKNSYPASKRFANSVVTLKDTTFSNYAKNRCAIPAQRKHDVKLESFNISYLNHQNSNISNILYLYPSIGTLESSDNHPIFHDHHLIKNIQTVMKPAESSGVAH